LLKTLISNVCVNDCGYCPYRNSVDTPRCTISPDAMAAVFLEYMRMKKVFGLFLSSSVVGSADHTMSLLNDTAALLRRKHGFRGYIHLKVIPGASNASIEESLSLATTVSINIETPGRSHCSRLSSKKDFDRDIIGPLTLISRLTGKGMKYGRVKSTTQFIVGASDEKDREIAAYTAGLYERLGLQRVYFSAYQAGSGDPSIPGEQAAFTRTPGNFMREHRLYQADFLLRKYGFSAREFIFDGEGNFSLEKDPKQVWADHHPEFFPVFVNRAGRNALLRIPGIGPMTADAIMRRRREGQPVGSWEQTGLRGKRLGLAQKYAVLS
jgi:predicted DNA-binding helix-hairpin-helix protein